MSKLSTERPELPEPLFRKLFLCGVLVGLLKEAILLCKTCLRVTTHQHALHADRHCSVTFKCTCMIDIIEYTLKQKWKWAGHIARLKDNRWTKRCTEWQPRRGKRSRGRPSRIWQDDITEKEGTTWIRKATDRQRWKTLMEGYILQWMDKA